MSQRDPTSAVRMLQVQPDVAGQRIDNFLVRVLKGVPRGHIYRILRRGEVRVNKGRIRPDYRMQAGDLVRIPPLRLPAEGVRRPTPAVLRERLQSAIILERDDLLVLDKPAGLAVHGGSGISWGAIEALRALRPQAPYLELVHRLDRDTSGCLLVAKSRSALRRFAAAFRSGQVQKRYLALSAGHWPAGRQIVAAPLSRFVERGGERVVQVSAQGRQSRTLFEQLHSYGDFDLVVAEPLTGRTHQIRVHAAHAGHPLAGDARYGDGVLNRRLLGYGLRRLFLHAQSLAFELDDTRVMAEAPLPPELRAVLDSLEQTL